MLYNVNATGNVKECWRGVKEEMQRLKRGKMSEVRVAGGAGHRESRVF